MINNYAAQTALATNSYTDLTSVQAIRSLGREDQHQAFEKIAGQFESMMVRMMLKSMRDANAVFAQGNMLSSNESQFYQNMMDDQLALSLSEERGLGLADMMMRQLDRRFGSEAPSQVSSVKELARNPALKPIASSQSEIVAPATEPLLAFDGSVEQFVEQIAPYAKQAAARLGVDADVLVAQAALETGWGVKVCRDHDGQASNNFFNIKADQRWQGPVVNVKTLEYRDGIAAQEVARFRAYESIEQSFNDYVDFVTASGRYQQALGTDSGADYIRCLHQAGYATDPEYADKVMRIASGDAFQSAMASTTVNEN